MRKQSEVGKDAYINIYIVYKQFSGGFAYSHKK